MSTLLFIVVLIASNAYLSFNRLSLKSFAITNVVILLAYLLFGSGSTLLSLVMLLLAAAGVFLSFVPLRQSMLSLSLIHI